MKSVPIASTTLLRCGVLYTRRLQAYQFSTSFDEGPSGPKRAVWGDVASSKASGVHRFSVGGLKRLMVKTQQPQHFPVCLERPQKPFCSEKTPESKLLLSLVADDSTQFLFEINKKASTSCSECGHCPQLQALTPPVAGPQRVLQPLARRLAM